MVALVMFAFWILFGIFCLVAGLLIVVRVICFAFGIDPSKVGEDANTSDDKPK